MGDEYVTVKFDYIAQEDQELTIKKNERLKLLDDSKNWWKVELSRFQELVSSTTIFLWDLKIYLPRINLTRNLIFWFCHAFLRIINTRFFLITNHKMLQYYQKNAHIYTLRDSKKR